MKKAITQSMCLCALTIAIWLPSQFALAQLRPGVPAVAKPGTDLITQVYPVADLVFSAPNYPFEGITVPGTEGRTKKTDMGGGIGGLGGGGFGGGGGMGGGGFGGGGVHGGGFGGGGFNVVPESGGHLLPEHGGGAFNVADAAAGGAEGAAIDKLSQAIKVSIHHDSWAESGGPGTIVALGDRLIVTTTKEIHGAVSDLLAALRTSGGARSTVTVRAWWLRLDAAAYKKLLAGMPPSSPPLVNRKQLEELAVDHKADYAEVTCFDGQTVHVISGRFRNAITGLIPVVGQAEPTAQPDGVEAQLAAFQAPVVDQILLDAVRANGESQSKVGRVNDSLVAMAAEGEAAVPAKTPGGPGSEGMVGYQPQLTTQHAGAMLEITPTRLPDSKAVVLDLRSIVNRWDEKPEPPVAFRNVVQLDRTNVVSQQVTTTLKLPVRQPVLVGGLSIQPGGSDADGNGQLYLVVEAIDETK